MLLAILLQLVFRVFSNGSPPLIQTPERPKSSREVAKKGACDFTFQVLERRVDCLELDLVLEVLSVSLVVLGLPGDLIDLKSTIDSRSALPILLK